MDGVTAVIVSYRQDLEKFSRCLGSVLHHGVALDKIMVIVNDDIEAVAIFQKISKIDPKIEVLHYSEISDWDLPLDWWSQQYFKLAISHKIQTPWYLLIDSDDVVIQSLDQSSLFDLGRARCLIESFDRITHSKTNNELLSWFNRALSIFGLTQIPDWTMGNLTPFMMNTEAAREVFESSPPECFDTRHNDLLSLEFYLYYAYLVRQNLFDHLYSPTKILGYAIDKRKK